MNEVRFNHPPGECHVCDFLREREEKRRKQIEVEELVREGQ